MKIALITSSRADWGLLEPLALKLVDICDSFRVIATGSHLSPEHGMTVKGIPYYPIEEIEILLSSDTPVGACKAMGLAMRMHPALKSLWLNLNSDRDGVSCR